VSQPHECQCRICGQSILFDPAVQKLIGVNQDPLAALKESAAKLTQAEAVVVAAERVRNKGDLDSDDIDAFDAALAVYRKKE